MPKRILVCGGRDYSDYTFLSSVMDRVAEKYPNFTLVHGAARGADKLSEKWAIQVGLKNIESYPADWNKYNKAAGHIRNKQMLDTGIDVVIAFPGGRGTANMVKIAKEANVQVWQPIRL